MNDELGMRRRARRERREKAEPSGFERLESIVDGGRYYELPIEKGDAEAQAKKYGYQEKYRRDRKLTGLDEVIICAGGEINNEKVVICIFDPKFMMGTLSIEAGNRLAQSIEYATEHRLPLIIMTASGGVRVQEGVAALVQMARINDALVRFRRQGLPYISVLMNPVMGGASASFALAGDINIAVQGATIGFSGKRIVQKVAGETVSSDFQTDRFCIRHGLVDLICREDEIRQIIIQLLGYFRPKDAEIPTVQLPKEELDAGPADGGAQKPCETLAGVRDLGRWKGMDYLLELFTAYTEIKGDRISADDESVATGFAMLDEKMPTAFIIQRRGRTIRENLRLHYGMTRPEGYRKAVRLARLAERFSLPILVLIDSPGASPETRSEANGQPIAISRAISEFLEIATPIVAVIIGEGNSGGALALAIGDRLAMLSSAIFSVISPEGYAEILHDGAKLTEQQLRDMGFVATLLMRNHLVDAVLPEQEDLSGNAKLIKRYFYQQLGILAEMSKPELLKRRYERVINWGVGK